VEREVTENSRLHSKGTLIEAVQLVAITAISLIALIATGGLLSFGRFSGKYQRSYPLEV